MNTSANTFAKQGQELADATVVQARAIGKRGINAVNDAAKQALETASDASDALLAFTRENPAKALLIAAASGALLLALAKALSPSRD